MLIYQKAFTVFHTDIVVESFCFENNRGKKKKIKKKCPCLFSSLEGKKREVSRRVKKKCQEKILQEQIVRNNVLRAVLGSWSQK